MATHKSAEKRHRQSLKRRAKNRIERGSIRTAIKKTILLAEGSQKAEAGLHLQLTTSMLDKAVNHGLLHKKNAQRRISRLHRKLNKLEQAAAS